MADCAGDALADAVLVHNEDGEILQRTEKEVEFFISCLEIAILNRNLPQKPWQFSSKIQACSTSGALANSDPHVTY